tara:strand:- start:152 stop:373 length:222 start_codon:yes stop_codon:yes gene_type:complete
MKLELNEKELVYIKWHLLSNKMYKDMTLPHGVVLWEEVWMQPFLDKIYDAINRTKLATSLEEATKEDTQTSSN